MAITIHCPACGEPLTLATESDRAKRLRCPHCDQAFHLDRAAKRPASEAGRPRWVSFVLGGTLAAAVLAVVLILVLNSGDTPQETTELPVTQAPAPGAPGRIDTRIIEHGADAEVPIPDRAIEPFVYLEEVDPYGAERPNNSTSLLRRELYRQAALIAARDELGVVTRDAVLGEVFPQGLPNQHRARVRVTAVEGVVPWTCVVETGHDQTLRKAWNGKSPNAFSESMLITVTYAEESSRTGLVTAMRRVGGWAPKPRKRSSAPVPAAEEALLARMTTVSQFAAVRGLHAAVERDGESPALLGALSRGYANLGLITDRLWDGTTWAFKARSLLYAERLRQQNPTDPSGLWHRAYALALAGLHSDALGDCKSAATLDAKAKPPAWAPLVEALCRFDRVELERRANDDGPLAQTAHLFNYLVVEDPFNSNKAVEVGSEFLKVVPECHRVQDSLARLGGVGFRHVSSLAGQATLVDSYTGELRNLAKLPVRIEKLLDEDEVTTDALIDGLTAAGRERSERAELTWAVLGRLARESRFTYIEARLSFLRYSLSVSPDEYLEKMRGEVADHPLFPLLESYTVDPVRRLDEFSAVLRKAPIPYVTYRQGCLIMGNEREPAATRPPLYQLSAAHGGNLYFDQLLSLWWMQPGAQMVPYARQLLVVSPYSPLARATLIDFDWQSIAPQAAAWEAECQHTQVFDALARQAMRTGKLDDAERLLQQSLAVVKDTDTYAALATVYLQTGDERKWLATMEEALTVPTGGLGPAKIRTAIARHYLRKNQLAKARKYADEAAETWAAWAMICAAECAEADNDLQAAEMWYRRVSERYEESYRTWYYCCLRTGQGDVVAARDLVQTHLKRVGTRRTDEDQVVAAVMLMADAKLAKAAPQFEAIFSLNKQEFYQLLAAVVWDAAGDVVNRDRVLTAGASGKEYAELFKLFRESLAKGESTCPSQEVLDAVVNAMPIDRKANAIYFVGLFARQRGNKKLADHYLSAAAKTLTSSAVSPVLAALALREK